MRNTPDLYELARDHCASGDRPSEQDGESKAWVLPTGCGESPARCNLSVIIPCHNDGRHLPEAVASVLRQEAPGVGLEIIIVDDHSSDPNTLDVLSSLEKLNRGVRVLHNTGPSGPAAARNVGIAAAQGEWIAFLDSDDVWVPGGLLARWQVIETQPDAQWIGGDYVYWHEDGTCDREGFYKTRPVTGRLVRRAYESGKAVKFVRPVGEFLQALLTWTGAVLVKRALLERVGGFDVGLKQAEDYHLWIRLAQTVDFYFVPIIVARYRQHTNSLTHGEDPPWNWCIKALHLLSREPAFGPYRAAIRDRIALCYWGNAYFHRARGERKLALRAAMNAVLHRPGWFKGWLTLAGAALGRK